MAESALDEMRVVLQALHNEGDPAWRFYYSFSARLALLKEDYPAAVRHSQLALSEGLAQAIDQQAS